MFCLVVTRGTRDNDSTDGTECVRMMVELIIVR